MVRRFAFLAGMLVWLLSSPVPAYSQDPVVGQTLGRGFHAYYAGDYYRAYELLSTAIRAGATDPRAWYFRGLVYLRLGREEEAKQDFAEGAKRELIDADRTFYISRSLERVQGRDRALLEQYRTEARMLAMQRAEEQRKARYEQLRRDESRVLLPPQAPGAPTSSVPFGTPPAKAPGVTPEIAKPATEPFEVEPTPPKPAEMPEGDPFAPVPDESKPGVKSAPAGQMPTEEPAAAEEEPFGAPAPAVPKPVAKQPAPGPAGDEGIDEDVFGAGPSGKPSAKKPTAKRAPAKTATQPQGSPFGGDPFGGKQ